MDNSYFNNSDNTTQNTPSGGSASQSISPQSIHPDLDLNSAAKPLRRGNACLACRKRRIRCNAEKPSCATCTRLHKTCVYESGKTTSRIAVLKDKVARLEQQIQTSRSDVTIENTINYSDMSTLQPAYLGTFTAGTDTSAYNGLGADQTPFPLTTMNPTHLSVQQPMVTNVNELVSNQYSPPVEFSDAMFNQYIPQTINPRPLQTPDALLDFDFSFLDNTMTNLANVMDNTDVFRLDRQQGVSFSDPACDPKPQPSFGSDSDMSGSSLVGGWWDPNDVPPHVRDHLLDLFFSRTGIFGLSFHVPRFYTRLTLTPSKRPHPSLLYAMYVLASSRSLQTSIRALSSQFFEIAEKQIKLAIDNCDRIFDAIRGSHLLGAYLFGQEKFQLAFQQVGSTIRMAISSGLHKIPSSVWTPPPPLNTVIHFTLRTSGYLLDPPEDVVELSERIHTFWAVYEVDQCTSIAYMWQSGFAEEDITTPFPKPMLDYELGLTSSADDFSIPSVLRPRLDAKHRDNSFKTIRMKAITLLSRAMRLRRILPEDLNTLTGPDGSHQCAKVRTPRAFDQLKQALDYYMDNLPDERRPSWKYWDDGYDRSLPPGSIGWDTTILHFLVGSAYMELWNVHALHAENERAVMVAKRMVKLIGLFQLQRMTSVYDTFIITIWNEVAMVLLREIKRLQQVGLPSGVPALQDDLDIVTAGLKTWAQLSIVHPHDRGSIDIAALHSKMLDRLRSMGNEEWSEAFRESQRRFGQ